MDFSFCGIFVTKPHWAKLLHPREKSIGAVRELILGRQRIKLSAFQAEEVSQRDFLFCEENYQRLVALLVLILML